MQKTVVRSCQIFCLSGTFSAAYNIKILFCNGFVLSVWVRNENFEIIVVDDGSPDGTQEIVKQLQEVYGEDRIVCLATYLFLNM